MDTIKHELITMPKNIFIFEYIWGVPHDMPRVSSRVEGSCQSTARQNASPTRQVCRLSCVVSMYVQVWRMHIGSD